MNKLEKNSERIENNTKNRVSAHAFSNRNMRKNILLQIIADDEYMPKR